MRVAYDVAAKHEAVALAAVIGAEAAADQLGMDVRSVRKWAAAAGKRPELDAPTDELRGLYDLAVARVTSDVVAGRIKGAALMTVVGIARDKLDRATRRQAQIVQGDAASDPDDPEPLTTAARHRFTDWIASLPDDDRRAVKRSLHQELNRRSEEGDPGPQGDATDAGGAALWDAIRLDMAAHLPAIAARVAAADALEAARQRQREIAGRWLPDDEADLLIQADKYLEEIA